MPTPPLSGKLNVGAWANMPVCVHGEGDRCETNQEQHTMSTHKGCEVAWLVSAMKEEKFLRKNIPEKLLGL